MTNETCLWSLFDEQERNDVADQLHFVGGFSSVLFLCLLLAYSHPSMETNRSYQNIGFFMLSAWLRRTTPFLMSFIIHRQDTYRQEMHVCRLFGFFETFMAIHEVECLTHICIERYVVAKYINNGWNMPKRHYNMFRFLCVLFAGTYSLAAALGIGGYGRDFTCLTCTMDMLLPDGLLEYFVIGIFVLRSLKPVGVMILMFYWARRLESKFVDTPYNRKQREITKKVMVLTAVNLACWAPIALIRGSVILTLDAVSGDLPPSLPDPAPPSFVKAALLLHWSSLACSTLTLFILSPSLRNGAIKFRFRHLSELSPKTQKTE